MDFSKFRYLIKAVYGGSVHYWCGSKNCKGFWASSEDRYIAKEYSYRSALSVSSRLVGRFPFLSHSCVFVELIDSSVC